MTRKLGLILVAAFTFAACDGDSDADETIESTETGDETGDETGACAAQDGLEPFESVDCTPAATAYLPRATSEDAWPACAPDDGEYHLIDTTPSSIARVEAFDTIVDILTSSTPGPDEFTAARVVYAEIEGLESRLVRREDVHYPAIPQADWVDGVDPDKQCTDERNVEKYPQRCAGPARIAPILNEAFVAGQQGTGSPLVNAARIEAALIWFLYLSVYKEATTCGEVRAKDCDSSWAYYTGGTSRSGGLGLAAMVSDLNDESHQAIFDAVAAARCWRDLYPEDDFPTVDDVDDTGAELFENARAQLDGALVHGLFRVIRNRLETAPTLCGDEAEANWAFLQVLGPALEFPAESRDPELSATLSALWQSEAPTTDELQTGAQALDALFPCP